MNITLIPSVKADKDFFRRVHHESYRRIIENMFGWDEALQDDFADKDFDARKPQIVEYNGERCGVVGWQDKGDHIWFGPIFVLPSYQNKGIGTHLVRLLIDQTTKENKGLKLQTLKQNTRAKELYESLGFKVTGASDIYWQMEYVGERV